MKQKKISQNNSVSKMKSEREKGKDKSNPVYKRRSLEFTGYTNEEYTEDPKGKRNGL